MQRRRFLKLTGLAVGGYALGRGVWFHRGEQYDLHLTEWEVPLPHLPPDLDGLRCLHFSDVHLAPGLSRAYLMEAFRALSRIQADVAFFTGDLLTHAPRFLAKFIPALAAIRAPRGKFAVLGNHDYFFDRAPGVLAALREAGWQVLRNRSLPLPDTGKRLWLVGVDDPVTGRADVTQSLAGVPRGAVRVALAHSPDLMMELGPGQVDLLLCGHTHGGQVVLPLIGPPAMPWQLGARYAWGLFNYAGTMLEVTRGVGMVLPYFRLNCPPELTVVTLRRAEAPPLGASLRPRMRRLESVWDSLRGK